MEIHTNTSEIILYQTEDGKTKIDVRLIENSVWLTIDQLSDLFQKSRSTINEHIINIFEDGELQESQTMRKIGISDFSTKPTNFYNLDVIISVGYRVKSLRGTQFRIWATERPKYLNKSMNYRKWKYNFWKVLKKHIILLYEVIKYCFLDNYKYKLHFYVVNHPCPSLPKEGRGGGFCG